MVRCILWGQFPCQIVHFNNKLRTSRNVFTSKLLLANKWSKFVVWNKHHIEIESSSSKPQGVPISILADFHGHLQMFNSCPLAIKPMFCDLTMLIKGNANSYLITPTMSLCAPCQDKFDVLFHACKIE